MISMSEVSYAETGPVLKTMINTTRNAVSFFFIYKPPFGRKFIFYFFIIESGTLYVKEILIKKIMQEAVIRGFHLPSFAA